MPDAIWPYVGLRSNQTCKKTSSGAARERDLKRTVWVVLVSRFSSEHVGLCRSCRCLSKRVANLCCLFALLICLPLEDLSRDEPLQPESIAEHEPNFWATSLHLCMAV